MIEITSLKKSYGEHVIFNNFSANIKDNEFVIFSGSSGCGKSTLLNILGWIEAYDSGSVTVDGFNLSKKNQRLKYYREKVGFLFQNFALVDNKTVKQNLDMVHKEARTTLDVKDALSAVGLPDVLNQKVYTLSGGEQQRVALARLMMKKCDIILADEPTGSLDRKNADIVTEILKKLQENGKTIIVATHDEQMKKCGDRVIVL
ncbi:MAG: ABC transporter ATP-binding protein [Oscillospiraceae bacterium]